MQIRPTNNIHSAQSTQAVNLQTRNNTEATTNRLPVDQVEISSEARLMSTQSAGNTRADRIADIKAQIAQGTYDSPERLEVAVSRMFDEFA